MQSVKMNREELLGIVRANKTKHVTEYYEAIEGYKSKVIEVTQFNMGLASSRELDRIAEIKPMPPLPVSYETSYNRAIRMLELSVEDAVDVPQDVFNQLVLDEWHWKNSFIATSALYK